MELITATQVTISRTALPPIVGASCWISCLRCRMGPKGAQSCAEGIGARKLSAGCYNGVKRKKGRRR